MDVGKANTGQRAIFRLSYVGERHCDSSIVFGLLFVVPLMMWMWSLSTAFGVHSR